MGHALRLTDANFEREVLESNLPVLVDFWASWCPPCKMMEPLIEAMAVEYGDRLKVGKINIDRNPKARERYQILGVPTFAVLRRGRILEQRTGAQSKRQLERMVSEALERKVGPYG
jgi:thioredoxin 1